MNKNVFEDIFEESHAFVVDTNGNVKLVADQIDGLYRRVDTVETNFLVSRWAYGPGTKRC